MSTAKTGYNVQLNIGVAVALPTEVNLEMTADSYEAADLNDDYVDTERGPKRWRMSGRANFGGSNAPLISHLDNMASTVLSITLTNAAGTTLFKGNGWMTRGTLNLPRAMGTQEFEVVGDGAPSTVL